MIINNYNGSLTENLETDLTSTKCPMINIRAFDPNIKAGEHLVIPYYVSDFDQTEYREEKLGPTFTTIITLDEDTVPVAQMREPWKQTTYAGEQVIDLGEFNDVGIHTLNVRTIQSNGVGSATKPLKFMVHPAGTKTVLDLNTETGFTGKFTGYRKYNILPGGSWLDTNALLGVYNCRYVVSKTVETVDGENKVTDIRIVVIRLKDGHCLTYYKLNDDGEVTANKDYAIDFNGPSIDGEPSGSAPSYDDSTEEIIGVFHVATKCSINGSTYYLADYLGRRMQDIPQEIMHAAAMNKVALTRLFEAAKAWRWQQVYEGLISGGSTAQDAAIEASDAVKYEFTFKMPKMDIVCDYHYANSTTYYTDPSHANYGHNFASIQVPYNNVGITIDWSLDSLNGTEGNGYADGWINWEDEGTGDIPGENQVVSHGNKTNLNSQQIVAVVSSQKVRKHYGRDDIRVLDGITVDLNESTLSMLQITNVKNGRLLHILNNVNSHVVNGSFVGPLKGYRYAHSHDAETLHLLSIHGSQFCSFDNLETSWTVGYELHVGNSDGLVLGTSYIGLESSGYIDYSGVSHAGESGNGLGWYRYDDNSYVRALQKTWPIGGRQVRFTRYAEQAVYNGTEFYFIYTKTCREMYVHFYDSNHDFVKTVKILQRWPVLIPYGAKYAKLSIYGRKNTVNGKMDQDYLFPNDNELVNPTTRGKELRHSPDAFNLSWCSGVDRIKIHDTRTCTLDNGGVQTYTKNVRWFNVSMERSSKQTHYEEDKYFYTKILLDQEDDAFHIYNWVMEGLNFIFGDTRAFSLGRGLDGHIKDCHNVALGCGGQLADVLIENCSGSMSFSHNEFELGTGLHYIIRNSLITILENGNGSSDNYEHRGKLHLFGNSLLTAPMHGHHIVTDSVITNDTIKL